MKFQEDAFQLPNGQQPKSFSEAEGPGDKRMSPSDVDVLDNLINAQAAFWEAWGAAIEHMGGSADSITDNIQADLQRAMAYPVGLVITAMSVERAT